MIEKWSQYEWNDYMKYYCKSNNTPLMDVLHMGTENIK